MQTMVQTVFIKRLAVNTVIGVFDWERAIKQTLLFDVDMVCDMAVAFISDDVEDVINYKTVCEDIEQVCHHTKAQLLEHLAYQVLLHLFDAYPCQKIKLAINKPHAINKADAVGVCIEITRNDHNRLIANNCQQRLDCQ